MRGRKVYGVSKLSSCSFCGKHATTQNEQGLEVCQIHVEKKLDDVKCTCGSWLEIRNGKFGPYFNCINCGNINYNKAMEIKTMTTPVTGHKESKPTFKETIIKEKPKVTVISSRDVDYFD